MINQQEAHDIISRINADNLNTDYYLISDIDKINLMSNEDKTEIKKHNKKNFITRTYIRPAERLINLLDGLSKKQQEEMQRIKNLKQKIYI